MRKILGSIGTCVKNHKICTIVGAVVLSIVIIGGVLITGRGSIPAFMQSNVTISFDSQGGSKVEDIVLGRGEEIGLLPETTKRGYDFGGWYYDKDFITMQNPKDTIKRDTVLYARFFASQVTNYSTEFIERCEPDVEFILHSDYELTNSNVLDYLTLESAGGPIAELNVKNLGESTYQVTAKDGFTRGYTNIITSKTPNEVFFLTINKEDVSNSEVASYSFYVYKEDVQDIVFKEGIKSLLLADVVDKDVIVRESIMQDGETGEQTAAEVPDSFHIQIYKGSVDVQKDDIVSIGEFKELSEQNMFYQIIDIKENIINGRDIYDVQAKYATPSQVYERYEVYFNQNVGMEELTDTLLEKKEEIIAQLKNSDEYWATLAATVDSLKECNEVKDALSLVSEEDAARFMEMSLKDTLGSLKGKVEPTGKLEIASDKNGQPYGSVVLGLKTNDIEFELGKSKEDAKTSIKVSFSVEISETFTVEVSGYTVYLGDDKYAYTASYLDSTTSVKFEATISVGDKDRDITDDLEKSMDAAGKKIQKYVELLKEDDELFETDPDYVTLVEVPIGKVSFTVYSFSIQLELTFKVSIGVQAGIGVDLSYHYREMIYSGNGELRLDTNGNRYIYHYPEDQKEKMGGRYTMVSTFHYSIVIKGKIGLRVGLNVNLNISLVGLNSVVNVGFSVEAGVYAELSGFIELDGWASTEGHGETLYGAFNLEIGVYIELAFTYRFFSEKGYYPLYTFKIPIIRIGASNCILGFESRESEVTMVTPEYNLPEDSEFNLVSVNLTGGQALVDVNFVGIAQASSASFQYHFFNEGDDILKQVTLDNSGHIKVLNIKKRLEFDIIVTYDKGMGIDGMPISKLFHVTYLPTGIDEPVTAHYYYGEELLYEETVLPGCKPVGVSPETFANLQLPEGMVIDLKNQYDPTLDLILEDTDYQIMTKPHECVIKYQYSAWDAITSENVCSQAWTIKKVEYGSTINLNDLITTSLPEGYRMIWSIQNATEDYAKSFNKQSVISEDGKLTSYSDYIVISGFGTNRDTMAMLYFLDYNGNVIKTQYTRVGEVPQMPELPEVTGEVYRACRKWSRAGGGNAYERINANETMRFYIAYPETMNEYVFYNIKGDVIAKKYAFSYEECDKSDIVISDMPEGYELDSWYVNNGEKVYEKEETENAIINHYQYTTYTCKVSFRQIKELYTITFEHTNDEAISSCSYLVSEYNIHNRSFQVPSIHYTQRDKQFEYSMCWEGKDKSGKVVTMKPGEWLRFNDYGTITMKPKITKTERIYEIKVYSPTTGEVFQTIRGKYGTVITQDQLTYPQSFTYNDKNYTFNGFSSDLPITMGAEGYNVNLQVWYYETQITPPEPPAPPMQYQVNYSTDIREIHIFLNGSELTNYSNIITIDENSMQAIPSVSGTAEMDIPNVGITVDFQLQDGFILDHTDNYWGNENRLKLNNIGKFGQIPNYADGALTLYPYLYIYVKTPEEVCTVIYSTEIIDYEIHYLYDPIDLDEALEYITFDPSEAVAPPPETGSGSKLIVQPPLQLQAHLVEGRESEGYFINDQDGWAYSVWYTESGDELSDEDLATFGNIPVYTDGSNTITVYPIVHFYIYQHSDDYID